MLLQLPSLEILQKLGMHIQQRSVVVEHFVDENFPSRTRDYVFVIITDPADEQSLDRLQVSDVLHLALDQLPDLPRRISRCNYQSDELTSASSAPSCRSGSSAPPEQGQTIASSPQVHGLCLRGKA